MSGGESRLTRQVRTLNAAGAQIALAAAEAAARGRGLSLSLAVVDVSGELLAFLRMDGTSLSSIEASRRKARKSNAPAVPAGTRSSMQCR